MAKKTRRAGAGTAATTGKGGAPIVPLAFALLVVLGIVAVVATRTGSDGGDGDADPAASVVETRPVDVTGAPLAQFGGDAATDPAVGVASPVVTGAAFDGNEVTIGQPGEPQLVFFVAHWCPHCQREVPVITKWIEESGPPEGVALKAVSTGVGRDRPNYPPSAWLEREGWPIETLADDEDSTAGSAFGLSAYPFFVAIDANGKIVARASGELGVDVIESLVAAARG